MYMYSYMYLNPLEPNTVHNFKYLQSQTHMPMLIPGHALIITRLYCGRSMGQVHDPGVKEHTIESMMGYIHCTTGSAHTGIRLRGI